MTNSPHKVGWADEIKYNSVKILSVFRVELAMKSLGLEILYCIFITMLLQLYPSHDQGGK